MIYIIATVKVKPECHADYIKGAKTCIAATRQEKGNIAYDLHQSVTEPNTFVFVERWENREAVAGHGTAPHMKVWREYSTPMKLEASVIEVISDAKVEVR